MKKIVIAILGALVLAAGIWYFAFSGNAILNRESGGAGETVATVNGEKITREEFEAFKLQFALQQGLDPESIDAETEKQLDEQAIDELISQKLLMQEIEKEGVTVSEEEVDAQMEMVKNQFESEEMFNEALKTEGLSEDELWSQIERDIAIQTYLENELDTDSITVTEEEIEEAYQQVVAGNEDVPDLEEVRDQVEQFVSQQKQQEMVSELIQKLREEADIER